jgi:hypothetical protein
MVITIPLTAAIRCHCQTVPNVVTVCVFQTVPNVVTVCVFSRLC